MKQGFILNFACCENCDFKLTKEVKPHVFFDGRKARGVSFFNKLSEFGVFHLFKNAIGVTDD